MRRQSKQYGDESGVCGPQASEANKAATPVTSQWRIDRVHDIEESCRHTASSASAPPPNKTASFAKQIYSSVDPYCFLFQLGSIKKYILWF